MRRHRERTVRVSEENGRLFASRPTQCRCCDEVTHPLIPTACEWTRPVVDSRVDRQDFMHEIPLTYALSCQRTAPTSLGDGVDLFLVVPIALAPPLVGTLQDRLRLAAATSVGFGELALDEHQ
jgi:hypothetical protein